MFLASLEFDPTYGQAAATLRLQVETYTGTTSSEGFLPATLRFRHMASSLHDSGASTVPQGLRSPPPRVRALSNIPPMTYDTDWSPPSIQGAVLVDDSPALVNYNRGRGDYNRNRDNARPGGDSMPRGARQGGNFPSRSPRMDRERRGGTPKLPDPTRQGGHRFDPNLICDCCKLVGHVASECNRCGAHLFVEVYCQSLTPQQKTQVMDAYERRHRERLGNPRFTNRRRPGRSPSVNFMMVDQYLEELGTTPEQAAAEMNWDSWDAGGITVASLLASAASEDEAEVED